MCVIRHHEHPIARHADAPVCAASGVADETLCARPLILPDLPAGARVQRITHIRAGHVHDAVHHDRRHLQWRSVRQTEHPFRHHPADVRLVDLRQRAIAAAACLSVVTGPVILRGHWAVSIAASAKQMNLPVITQQLQVGHSSTKLQPLERSARRKHHIGAHRLGTVPRFEHAEKGDQIASFRVGQIRECGHAGGRQALAKQRPEFIVGPRRHASGNGGPQLASVTVGAVASSTTAYVDLTPGIRSLRCDERIHDKHAQQCGSDSHCSQSFQK